MNTEEERRLYMKGIPENMYVAGKRPHCINHCAKTHDDFPIIREEIPCTNHELADDWENCWECYIGSK